MGATFTHDPHAPESRLLGFRLASASFELIVKGRPPDRPFPMVDQSRVRDGLIRTDATHLDTHSARSAFKANRNSFARV